MVRYLDILQKSQLSWWPVGGTSLWLFFTEEGEATWGDGLQYLLAAQARGAGAWCLLLPVRCCLGQRGAGKGMSLDGSSFCHDWGQGGNLLEPPCWAEQIEGWCSLLPEECLGNCGVPKSVVKSTWRLWVCFSFIFQVHHGTEDH